MASNDHCTHFKLNLFRLRTTSKIQFLSKYNFTYAERLSYFYLYCNRTQPNAYFYRKKSCITISRHINRSMICNVSSETVLPLSHGLMLAPSISEWQPCAATCCVLPSQLPRRTEGASLTAMFLINPLTAMMVCHVTDNVLTFHLEIAHLKYVSGRYILCDEDIRVYLISIQL